MHYLRLVCNPPSLALCPSHPLYQSIKREYQSIDDINLSGKLVALKQLILDCGVGVGVVNENGNEDEHEDQETAVDDDDNYNDDGDGDDGILVLKHPSVKYSWLLGYKDGQVVESYKDKPATSNRFVKENELLFMHLDTQDEGVYYCNASNIHGWTISNNASVRIAFLNKDIIGPEPKIASVGETVLMECKPPKGIPKPSVIWKFNGNVIEVNKRIKILDNGNLRIDKATRKDSGRYNCVAKNFADERDSSSAMLTVRQKPQFKIAPSNIEVKVNEAAVFPCVAEGDPKPTIVWRRDNQKKIPSSRAILLDNKGMQISKVQLSDMGNYICHASNSAGHLEAYARLSVVSTPGFLETPENQKVRVGDTAKFNCRVTGSPQPTIIWGHNGDHFIADEENSRRGERIQISKDGTLIISPVKISDSGKYECKASSYTGKIQSSAYLNVIDSQKFVPPVIEVGPQNQTLRSGLTATFNCQPKQPDELVTVNWLKNGQQLNSISDPRIIQLTTGTMKINLLRMSDAGNYTCKVIQNEAFTMWSVSLKMIDKNGFESAILQTTDDARMLPSSPTNFEVIERGDSWITFKWESPPHEESNIIHYLIEYSPYESRQGWYMQSILHSSPGKIVNLHPETGYRFLIRSVNDIGIGNPNVIPFVVFTSKKQHYSQLNYSQLKTKVENVYCENLKMKSVSTDQITIVWHVAGPPAALKLLSGFIAKYKRVPLSRCLSNNKGTYMEHCSLSESLLSQIELDTNNPKSIFNEEGSEEMKLVPMTDRNDQMVAYTIIPKLEPFVCYEVYVQPYLDHPKYGKLTGTVSKSITILTYDSVPTKSPTDLTARWLSNTSVEISWKPAPKQYINGILKGYSLHIIGNDTNSTRSIEVSPKSTIVRVQDLILNMPYVVHIAASTCQGEGIRSAGLMLTASSTIITMSPNLIDRRSGLNNGKSIQASVTKQPWFISIMVVGGCLWFMICAFILVVGRSMYLRGLIYKSGYSNGTKLIANTSHQIVSHMNTNTNSNASGMYKDSIILQPLIGTSNSVSPNEYQTDPGEAITNSTSIHTTLIPNSSQRRFQDSISSSNSTCKSSTSQPIDKQKQRYKLDKNGPGIMLNLGHAIPPPPEFPPPPAPISPTASNSTYYLQPDIGADDGTCSYASCPINVPISNASTTISPIPGYLWSAKHNSLVPVPGYIDYSCVPFNMMNMTHHSDTISIASSFALPPPHDMLSMTHLSDDPYLPGSNGANSATQLGLNGYPLDLSSMVSSHISNGNGSSSSAILSGNSTRDFNKYESITRSGQNDDSTSLLEEDEEADKSEIEEEEEEEDDHSNDCNTSDHSNSLKGWQNSSSIPSKNFIQMTPSYFSQSNYTDEDATYDICAEDQHVQEQRCGIVCNNQHNYYPPNNPKDFFPPPPNGSYYENQLNHCYDNPPTGQLTSTNINPFRNCGYLGETPIV
uniref:Roundabout n=1 Tax=Dugesia japonica TaxID=6161 RepID=E1CHK8_DUGJA|nr:roundabout [Dugesia japonica]